jgi:hypothetical protein
MPKQISHYSLADEWNGIIFVSGRVSSVVIVEIVRINFDNNLLRPA